MTSVGNNIGCFAGRFHRLRGFSAGVVECIGHLVEAVVEQVPVENASPTLSP